MQKRDLSDVVVLPDTKIHSVCETISRNGVRGVFVCDENNELLGIVMDADIRRGVLSNLDLNISVKTIMKTTPFVIKDGFSPSDRKQLLIRSDKILAPIIDEKRCIVDLIYLPDVLDDRFNNECIDRSTNEKGVFPPEKILIIGGAGYIGSVLTDKFLRMGYAVRVLDLLLYGKESILRFENMDSFEFVRGDCRNQNVVRKALQDIGAVVHLGEIVGDPACSLNESFTIETNYVATQRIVDECMRSRVKRLIFASSCSVYGQNDNEVNEESEPNPVSLYARCKIESENAILSSSDNHVSPTILRLSTVHGKSYRQRYDLVVNLLTAKALIDGKIEIFGGEQWRPFISVQDVCQGILLILRSDRPKIRNKIFNLGDSRENYKITQIGNIIKEAIPEVKVEAVENREDSRNYRVNFDKIRNMLGYSAEYTVMDSVKELLEVYRLDKEFLDYKNPKCNNYLSLKL